MTSYFFMILNLLPFRACAVRESPDGSGDVISTRLSQIRNTWAFLRQYMYGFDSAIFTMRDFVPPDFPLTTVDIIPPAIDPISPKNMPLTERPARQVLQWIGIEPDRPLITQVSRFDSWKDPFGVIAVYRMLRDEFPGLQLAMVGSMALDDPEGWNIYNEIMKEARADPEIHVFTNIVGVGNVEVNAFQRLSQVIIQKSIREGFGLVVSEAMWKCDSSRRRKSRRYSFANGRWSWWSARSTARKNAPPLFAACCEIRTMRTTLPCRGKERVQCQFLLPRLLLNELCLMKDTR